jgi:DNA-nicking Smr family endonuclease
MKDDRASTSRARVPSQPSERGREGRFQHSVSDDDALLFRRTVGAVSPVETDRVTWHGGSPPPVPAQSHRDQERVLAELLAEDPQTADLETGDDLWYQRHGLQHGILRKLRRGQFAVQAELDLHGMTVPVARAALASFLSAGRREGLRCVRIVHGKGNGSPGRRPVLKSLLGGWLRRRREVLAFCSARPADGGTGAVYVLLART